MDKTIFIPRAGQGRNQGLRTALVLAALSRRAVRLGGLVSEAPRPRPGLGAGNFTAAAAAAAVTAGSFELGREGSELLFVPGRPAAGDYSFDVARERPSPAPLSLVLEVVAPILAAAGGSSQVILSGGTHVPGGFTSDEVRRVLVPTWGGLGLPLEFMEISPGFLPGGAGEAELRVSSSSGMRSLKGDDPFQPLELGIEVVISGLPLHLAEQALEGAQARLNLHRLKASGRIRRARGSAGMSLLIWARGRYYRVGFAALGRRGGRPEALANNACEALVGFLHSGAGLPAQLAAALLASLVCAAGVSRLTVDRSTPALKAAVQAADAFFPGAVLMNQPRQDAPLELRISGRGLL